MEIVFFSHPTFLASQSMPRFTRMLAEGMKQRGHRIEVWSPQPRVYRLPIPLRMRKWFGYVDLFIVFPLEVRSRLKHCSADTLFVFTDQALGPWVPLVEGKFHVVHCHDFLAQRSALGEFPINATSWTGQLYQRFIRKGYSRGKHFISVSQKTKEDLHRFLPAAPVTSEIVYNGLNQSFEQGCPTQARDLLSGVTGVILSEGFILHVGGNPWYKNRLGVIEIYNAWRLISRQKHPLLLIGEEPSPVIIELYNKSPFKSDIYLLSGFNDILVRTAYKGALVLLFPSLAEGFGWPIAEAMASGCPVITTNEAPMTEVAGEAGYLIPKRPFDEIKAAVWATDAAKELEKILGFSSEERMQSIEAGILNAKRFDPILALDKIEAIYQRILNS